MLVWLVVHLLYLKKKQPLLFSPRFNRRTRHTSIATTHACGIALGLWAPPCSRTARPLVMSMSSSLMMLMIIYHSGISKRYTSSFCKLSPSYSCYCYSFNWNIRNLWDLPNYLNGDIFTSFNNHTTFEILAACKPCNTDVKLNYIQTSKVSKADIKHTARLGLIHRTHPPDNTIVEMKNVMGVWLWRMNCATETYHECFNN